MEQILYIRETLIRYFKLHETIILFIAKFIAGLIIFQCINSIGYSRAEIGSLVSLPLAFPYVLLMGILFTALPLSLSYGLMILNIALSLSANIEIAAFVTGVLFCILCFYVRLAPKESSLILATVFAFYFRIPYLVPLLAGLYFRLTCTIPITIGVFIWSFVPVINSLMSSSPTADLNIMEMPESLSQLLPVLINQVSANQQWILVAFIFAMVVIVVYAISRLSVDFSKELAILLGAVLNLVSFIIAVILTGISVSILSVFFFTLLSLVLAEAVRFFDSVLDYQRAERVQFEDEENYYYVRVIPKAILTRKQRTVRRIRPARDESWEMEELEEE